MIDESDGISNPELSPSTLLDSYLSIMSSVLRLLLLDIYRYRRLPKSPAIVQAPHNPYAQATPPLASGLPSFPTSPTLLPSIMDLLVYFSRLSSIRLVTEELLIGLQCAQIGEVEFDWKPIVEGPKELAMILDGNKKGWKIGGSAKLTIADSFIQFTSQFLFTKSPLPRLTSYCTKPPSPRSTAPLSNP